MKIIFSLKIYFAVRLLLSAIFFYSGITKIFNPAAFAIIISGYGVLPDFLVPVAAVGLPLAEIFIAIGLCFDLKGTLTFYSGLMVLFMAVLVHGILIGLDTDCGCFGPEDLQGQAFHSLREALFRDVLIFAGCIYLYFVRLVHGITPVPVRKRFLWFGS